MELEHAGKVFPGTRREVHTYLTSVGYDYVATLAVDDLFVRRDLNTPEELGLDRDFPFTVNFYQFYNFKTEGVPGQEEWDRREAERRDRREAERREAIKEKQKEDNPQPVKSEL